MKKMYKYLRSLPVILLGLNLSASAQMTTFNFTGGVVPYVVPPHVTSLNILVEGAKGGNNLPGTSQGALGGRVLCDMNVTPGQTLYVTVGQDGAPSALGAPGGFNGGGSTPFGGQGGSGGGASDIRMGGTTLADRILVAGGGGGAGFDCAGPPTNLNRGGQGGGLTGETGYFNTLIAPGSDALGGKQIPWPGTTLGTGGNAIGNGGGGGGGYYGGQAGANIGPLPASVPVCGGYGGGGGGSAYADPTNLTSSSILIGGSTSAANGYVSICAPGRGGIIHPQDSVCVGTTVAFIDTTGTPGGVWASSDPLIATVNPVTGDVTGMAPGVVNITRAVTTPCGNATASVTITVRAFPNPITGTLSVCTNDVTTLASTTPGGTWSSSDNTIATVVAGTGVVTGMLGGPVTITYSDNGCKVSTPFTVIQGPAPITGTPNACVGYPSLFADATPFGVWSSMTPAIGSIDALTGALTGVSPGPVTISYTVGGCSSTLLVLVSNPPGAIFGPNSICAGDVVNLIQFGFGGTWSNKDITKTSVNSFGDVTGLSGGADTIYYTIGGCPPAEFPMSVNQAGPIVGITSICKGSVVPLTDTSVGGTWSSSDPTIAVIDPVLGLLTAGTSAVIGSTATITYTTPTSCFSTLDVSVDTAAPPIAGPDSVCEGSMTLLTNDRTDGTWSSTDLSIAQIVDISGVITGISAGIVNVSYTLSSGCAAAMSFRVKPLISALTGLVRTPSKDTLCQGTPVRIYANPAFAGSGPTYSWSLFGVEKGTTDTFNYTPVHGDVIVVTMKVGAGVCATTDTVRDSITYNIDSIKAPTISISLMGLSPDTIRVLGQDITFFSTVHYGGEGATYQWYRNNTSIPGATASSYKTQVYYTDTFYCIVNGNPPCIAPMSVASNEIIIYNAMYLNTKTVTNGNNSITLFPNPNKGVLTVSGSVNSDNELNLEIIDMLGRTVYTGTTTPVNGSLNKEIVLDNSIVNGNYMLRVNTSNGYEVLHFVVNK